MMKEQWTRWEPIKGLKETYDIESLSNSTKGLEMILGEYDNEKNKIKISFENSVLTYKQTNESYRIYFFGKLKHLYTKNRITNNNFFKTNDSPYIQQFLKESNRISDTSSLIHFLIMDDELVVDIISDYEPTVEIINE